MGAALKLHDNAMVVSWKCHVSAIPMPFVWWGTPYHGFDDWPSDGYGLPTFGPQLNPKKQVIPPCKDWHRNLNSGQDLDLGGGYKDWHRN